MKLLIFGVYDSAVQAFLQPMFFRSKGEGIRAFTAAANEEGHQFKKHASDYTLFFLGDYDDGGAVFTPLSAPERMVTALEVLNDDVFPPGRKVS